MLFSHNLARDPAICLGGSSELRTVRDTRQRKRSKFRGVSDTSIRFEWLVGRKQFIIAEKGQVQITDFQLRKDLPMIVVRNVFRQKFGKAKEAVALLREGIAMQRRAGVEMKQRIMTDLVGTFYTLVLELTVSNMAELEANMPRAMGDKDWQANYQRFSALVESGYREIFTLVE